MHSPFPPNAIPSAPAFRRIVKPAILPPDAVRCVPAPFRPRAAAAPRANQSAFYRAASLAWLAISAASIWIAVLY